MDLDEYLQLISRVVAKQHDLSGDAKTAITEWHHTLPRIVERRSLPTANETVAVAFKNEKVSALLYDRVWCFPDARELVPDDIAVFGATVEELCPVAFVYLQEKGLSIRGLLEISMPIGPFFKEQNATRALCNILYKRCEINAVAIYGNNQTFQQEYKPGNDAAILAALSDLDIVDESKLTWEQVREFRSDSEAKVKFRRMRNWLNETYSGKSVAEITDAIGAKLGDYEWCLKKHGLETIVGTLSELIDPRVLTTAAATAAGLGATGGAFWAALGGAGIMAGKATVSVTRKLLDLGDRQRGQGSEVAFVHALKKLAAN